MSNALYFLLLIGPLILVHEMGHMLVAKALDVNVTHFSIGFGPTILRVKIGETEYRLAPIPLGGYVRMLGQDPYEEIPPHESDRALSNKPLWARYCILAAGPVANFILPLVIIFFLALGHTSQAPPVVGTVFDDSAAADAEIQPGDRIVSIDSRDVHSFSEMRDVIAASADQELELEIKRGAKVIRRFITPRKTSSRNRLGALESRGILGVSQRFYEPQIGILDPNSPAWEAGLRTGDIVTSINGEPVRTIEALEQMLRLTTDARLRLTYLRPVPKRGQLGTYLWLKSHHAQLLPRKDSDSDITTGMLAANTFIRRVIKDSPADLAGLVAGDRILAVDDTPTTRWESIDTHRLRRRTEPMVLRVHSLGDNDPHEVTVTQVIREETDHYKSTREYLWLGTEPFTSSRFPDLEPIRGRFTYAVRFSLTQTATLLHQMAQGLKQMLLGEQDLDEIHSVLYVFYVAGVAADQGAEEFFLILAFISLSIGFFNLLPIPVLDGGTIAIYTVEAIRRKPVSQRARERASLIGVVFLGLIFLKAIRNDIVDIWFS